VALVGNPNTGKTTLFNRLTGFRHRVGNYPGVTVEKRTGRVRGGDRGQPLELLDLPGAYSLAAQGADEAVLLDALLGRHTDTPAPDLIVCVIDASNLGRNLFFATQVFEVGRPVVVALNMMDVAERRGIQIDTDRLSHELGVPVVPVVATVGRGVDRLISTMVDSLGHGWCDRCPDFPACVCAELDGLCESLARQGNGSAHARVEALQTLLDPGGYHESRLMQRCGRGLAEELAERRARIAAAGESIAEVEAKVRYHWIDGVVRRVLERSAPSRSGRSERIDRVLTHPVIGLGILLLLTAMCFQSIYAWAGPLMDWIDSAIASSGAWLGGLLPDGALRSLVVDGAVAGVGGVLVFLPQILILFLFIAILEDCGYMARAAFLLDRWMTRLGLNGQAFIPLVSSFACAVPGIMATRTIDDRRDRFVTILIAPLMSCSARLPVYVLLIGAFIPATAVLGGWLNLQAVVLLGMYLTGAIVAIPIAWMLKRWVFRGAPPSFLMELPTYKFPSLRTVFHRVFEQGRAFVVSAGTVIFACSIVIWALAYYPRPASVAANVAELRAEEEAAYRRKVETAAHLLAAGFVQESVEEDPSVIAALRRLEAIEAEFDSEITGADADAVLRKLGRDLGPPDEVALTIHEARRARDKALAELDHRESGEYLRQSFLGRMGHWIEPAVRPLGWDWRIGTAAIASFPAREVVVATMGTIYNLGGETDERSAGLRDKLREAKWPDGRPVFNSAVALSIMVFFALCCQCVSTLAIIKRETQTWRWPVVTFVYMTALAYAGALIAYQVASRMI